jgi:hypothetical protein
VPDPGEPDDVWWFGFDCAHWMDVMPGLIYVQEEVRKDYDPPYDPPETYKNQEYVMEEVTRLASQLAAMNVPTTTT